MNKKKTILFDFDGTLINSIDSHLAVILDIAKKNGVSFSKDEFAHYNGMSTKDGFKKMMREKHITFRGWKLVKMVYERLRRENEILENISIYPETKPMLEKLQAENYPMCVATSSNRHYLERFVSQFDIRDYFLKGTTIDDVRHAKPAPDIFIVAAKRMKAIPSECVVVEDSVNGIIAAKRAGMKTIAVLQTTKKELFVGEAKPDAIVKGIADVPRALKKL